jgi:opacity protein-like surface antigen
MDSMKKIALAVLLATTATATWAETKQERKGYFYGIRWENQDGVNGGRDANTYGMKFGKHVNSWLDLSVSTRVKDTTEGVESNDTRLEAGVKFKHKINQRWSTSLYLGSGDKYVKNDNHSYWVVTPGVKYKIDDKWSLGTSVRFRDSYDTDNQQQDTTYAAKVGYKIADDTTLDFRYRIKRGDSDYNAWGFGLNFEF